MKKRVRLIILGLVIIVLLIPLVLGFLGGFESWFKNLLNKDPDINIDESKVSQSQLSTLKSEVPISKTSSLGSSLALQITEFQITDNPSLDWISKIDEDIIAFVRIIGWGYTLFFYDLSTNKEEIIAINTGFPSVHKDKIVFEKVDVSFASSNIYMYDISTSQIINITKSTSWFSGAPDIYGEIIVFLDNRNGDYDIYMYNITSEQERPVITNPLSFEGYPFIYKNKIVWEDYRNGINNPDIYMYDLSKEQETQITTDPSKQVNPDIYGNIIVWEDYRNGINNPDIYMYDLSKEQETQITTDPSKQIHPAVYKDIIVWEDYRNGDFQNITNRNADIYMFNLSSGEEIQITNNTLSQTFPCIYENKIVYSDAKTGTGDLYTSVLGNADEFFSKVDIKDIIAVAQYIGRADCSISNNWCDGRDIIRD
jgi:beta propeller repeat protein